jgi:spore maturation protein CgeB
LRLLKITTNYPNLLRQFYSNRSKLKSQPYAVQHAALMSYAAAWGDFWSVAFSKLGYETGEIVSNAEPMQKQWARERGVAYEEASWILEITTAQVKAFRPDVLFVNDYVTYTAAYLRRLRDECPSLRLVLGWCGAPYIDETVFNAYDVVLSSVPELVKDFRDRGHRCLHVKHAFEPRVLERIDGHAALDTDFAFIGSVTKRDNFHLAREELLLSLIEQTPLTIWADFHTPTLRERGGMLMRHAAYDAVQMARRARVPEGALRVAPPVKKVLRWERRPEWGAQVDPRLLRRARPAKYGVDMFQQLHNSRISLNTHIDISSCYASNMRLYEATGVGSCLMTDWKDNLPELFEPDTEVVTYRSAEECVEKVRYLLEHERERSAIAEAGQRRVIREHTFDHRAAEVHELIRHYFAEGH